MTAAAAQMTTLSQVFRTATDLPSPTAPSCPVGTVSSILLLVSTLDGRMGSQMSQDTGTLKLCSVHTLMVGTSWNGLWQSPGPSSATQLC